MNNLPAIIVAVAGLVTAISTLVALILHKNSPAHAATTTPPAVPKS